MKAVLALFLLAVCNEVRSQCYIDSDIAIHWSQLPGNSPFQETSNQCLANYTIFNENRIDDSANKGVTCSRKNSTATTGTWTYNGSVVDCGSVLIRCVTAQGSTTLYTRFGADGSSAPWPNGVYTCCIEGDCISIRVYQEDDLGKPPNGLFPSINDAVIESCSIIPPSDITVTPQQYIVQMNTSGVPPTRLVSNIDCTNNCGGTTRGESYYTLVDLTDERYQYSVPVTRSTDTINTNHQYDCRARFGNGEGGTFLSTTLTTSITASSTPTVDYEVINATAVSIQWSITGDVSGFVIKITSSGLSTVTQQVTNSTAREFTYNGILPERNYTVEVRGYYELLGLADTITVRLEAGISSVNGSLVSVSNDLSTHQIQVNCYTFRVQPHQVTWNVGSMLITPDSSYQFVNGSELLDSANQTYRHYITLNGSFVSGTNITCSVTVNGETQVEEYTLEVASSPPTGLSATILSNTSLCVSWTQLPDVTGYIAQYIPNGQPQLLDRTDTSSDIFEGLTQGTIYQISVYSYKGLPSVSSIEISVLLDAPNITSFSAQPMTPTSAMVSWNILNSIIDNYTVSYTRLCDDIKDTMFIENGTSNSTTINNLYPGLQYYVSITPVNILGKGMERTDSVTLEESGSPTTAPLLQPPVVINSTAVRLTWGEVDCTQRNGVITGYSIQYNIDGDPQPTIVNVTGVTTTVITSLITFRLYYISVAAINRNGISPYSQESKFYTIDTAISGLSNISSTRFVKLSWQPLMNVTNVIFTYEVAYIIRPDNTECSGDLTILPDGYTVYPLNTSSDNIEVFGLMPGTCYAFGVRAYTSVSDSIGEFSVILGATVSEAVGNFVVSSSITFAELSWNTLPEVSIDTYTYEVGFAVSSGNEQCSQNTVPKPYANTTNGTAEVTGLEGDTCYSFGVRVYSSRIGEPGNWSIVVKSTLPQVVSNVAPSDQQAATTTSVQLSWTPLTTQTDDSFTYEVGYIAQPSNTQCTGSLNTLPDGYISFGNTTDTSIEVTGLKPGTCYLFGVRVYSSRSTVPGEWTLLLQQTDTVTTTTTTTTTTTSSTTATTTSSNTMPSMSSPPAVSSSGSSIGLVAGGAGGGIVAVLAIIVSVIVIVIILRRRSGRKSNMELLSKGNGLYQNESDHFSKVKSEQEYVEMDVQKKPLDELYSTVDSKAPSYEPVTNIYANTTDNDSSALYSNPSDQAHIPPPFDPMIPETFPVPVNDLGHYVSEKHFSNNTGFKEQFKTLYTGEEKSCAIGQRDEYKLLNRFKNITVYDDNHILLKALPTTAAQNEFINGGYVDGYNVPRKYIATQGPLPKTVGDFWHMVWQEKVRFIVMLTNLIEEKKKKCARYWPEEVSSSETYGHFNVTTLVEEPLLHFVIRTLRVELMGTSDSVIVKHYQYITWPDYGVPESVSPFMTLNRRVVNSWSKDKGPMIVHCSAGVGRTGTFIAVDMALEQAEKERKVDIAGIVSRLREQRMKMVQTDAQYAFIHDAVLEAVVAGSTEIEGELFEAKLMKWRQPVTQTGITPIQTQFQLLGMVTPDQDDVMKQTAEKFPVKNRTMQFLPPEKWRVVLKGEVPDYIHATFIHGYREKKAFIIAQSPMQNTVRDFWKMIMNYKVSAIVMCCGEQENRKEVCFPYWDQNAPVCFGDLVIEVKFVTQENGFVRRDLQVNDSKGTFMNVVQFQFTTWPNSGVFKAPQVVLKVMDEIGRVQRKSGKGPVVVHCSDTVGRSGVFCAASNAIEQCKTEQLVDVFQATKAVRMHKPGSVTSLEQYDFIHDVALRYIEQNSAYSNFQTQFQ